MAHDELLDETYFDVFGPFDLSRDLIVSGHRQSDMWSKVEGRHSGLSTAIGCYLFCLKRGEVVTPWYVGMTIAKGGFEAETFTLHKLEIYRRVLARHPNSGRPQLIFFPLMLRQSGRFGRGATKKRPIAWLERMLMGFAYWQNDQIENTRDMKYLRNVTVNGLLGKAVPGRPRGDVKLASQALFGAVD